MSQLIPAPSETSSIEKSYKSLNKGIHKFDFGSFFSVFILRD